jgi:phosphatidylinositol alpha-mannosyltransferase
VRIAITHPYSWPEVRRGAERIIVETARALGRRGHDVTIITAGSEGVGRHVEGFTTVKLRRRFTDASRHERWFGARIVPLLLAGRYDAVHAMMPSDALAAIATRPVARHRVLYEELGIPLPGAWREPSPGHPPLKDRPIRHLVARHVDVYGCMSQHALDAYEHHFATGRGALVPGGVDTSRFHPADRREPAPTVLFSGVLDEPRKGVAVLLEAIALVSARRPDAQLWLSGPGRVDDLLASAPQAARERTTVLDLGDPADQGHRYATAWATVLPSIFESFGMVLLESLACGTPIVVADHSAPPELARPGAGFVTSPGDPSSLAEGISAAFAIAEEPGTVTRCREVAEGYDWDQLAQRLEGLYRP